MRCRRFVRPKHQEGMFFWLDGHFRSPLTRKREAKSGVRDKKKCIRSLATFKQIRQLPSSVHHETWRGILLH